MDGYYSLEGWLAPSMVHVCIMLDVYFHNSCSILKRRRSVKYTINVIATSFYSCFYMLILHILCRKIAHVANVNYYTKTDGK